MPTKLDALIEATRRGFLKQIAGTFGAMTAPISKSVAAPVEAAKSFFDLGKVDLKSALASYWTTQNNDLKLDDITLERNVLKLQRMLSSGKMPKNVALVKHLLYPLIQTTAYEDLGAWAERESQHDDQFGDWYNRWFENWTDNLSTENIGTVYDAMSKVVLPRDIVYKGRTIMSANSAVEQDILSSPNEVKSYFDDMLCDWDDYSDSIDELHDRATDGKSLQRNDKIKDAQKEIDNTHSNLGTRRDSAWYESVMRDI